MSFFVHSCDNNRKKYAHSRPVFIAHRVANVFRNRITAVSSFLSWVPRIGSTEYIGRRSTRWK